MRVIIQRVKKATCRVEGKTIGHIEAGMMLLVGFTHTDTMEQIDKMVQKIVQFTVYAICQPLYRKSSFLYRSDATRASVYALPYI